MLSVVILALEIMNHEAISLGIQVNWLKTKIQITNSSFSARCPWLVTMSKSSFTYLGVDIHNTGSTKHDIRKRIAIARTCMSLP